MNAREFVSKRYSLKDMKKYLHNYPQNFQEVVSEIFNQDIDIAWRAAWIVGHGINDKDPRMAPFVDRLIELIPDNRDGFQRELLKLLIRMELDEDQEGVLFDICMNIWEKVSKPPSVRMNSFLFIAKVVEKYPELKPEVSYITQVQYTETLSPGIRKSFERKVEKLFRNEENRPPQR